MHLSRGGIVGEAQAGAQEGHWHAPSLLVEAVPNARWSVAFVHDQRTSGRRLRILTVNDDVTKECLAAVVDTSISGRRVARELSGLVATRGSPDMIVSDQGTEFTSNAMLEWTQKTGVPWHFIAPGKPMQNGIWFHRGIRSPGSNADPSSPSTAECATRFSGLR
ncbi:hypothetical protein OCH239_15080 [Roseivivax halodurans JCM 10272]|uniref:Integrase catalytic domain-containing protein n=1 Tax=Roseivivax halodurans JCM 10272 TaxID=1449350 RepID=X7EAN0_9RHOB|nr:hypothetical protein OCH239_15080 [Roseivivax halodurans JCM 10272]